MSKIYVGNLPFTATEDAVRTLFAQHGTVESVALMSDRETGRLRGFGVPRSDATRAIQNLNGHEMAGPPLRINEAQDKPRAADSSVGGRAIASRGAHMQRCPTCRRKHGFYTIAS